MKALGDSAPSFDEYLAELREGNPKAPSGAAYFWDAQRFAKDGDATFLNAAFGLVSNAIVAWAAKGDEKATRLLEQYPHLRNDV